MNDVLKRLAKRLWKCPFDDVRFGSLEDLRSHLMDSHEPDICQSRRLPGTISLGDIDRPTKLTFCGHCLAFAVPHAPDRNAISEIDRHTRQEHPNPKGPTTLTLNVTEDSTLIGRFVEEQMCEQVFVCSAPGCDELFASVDNVAAHWTEKHCSNVTVEEARGLVETEPERFADAIEESLAEKFQEDLSQHRRSFPDPEDGYHISHSPDVPRVRSRPSESIVYIERERVRFSDAELEELLKFEGLDFENESSDDVWAPGRRQTACIELRFCNIVDGYIPRVKSIRDILPPLTDGATIEVSWQDEPQTSFPCKVSKTKRAIYNPEKKLKQIFQRFPSGVRLYITRVGTRRYHLHVNRQPHVVRSCKFFEIRDERDWSVRIQDCEVEWETGNDVFRHHLTFEEMDALYLEAQRTNLSIRDAVHDAMSQMGQGEPVHVRDIYDAVFLRMRTCSLAAVWAQFRPEHECYERVSPGWYHFNPLKPFPLVLVRPIEVERSSTDVHGHAPATRIRIIVRWSRLLGRDEADETIMTTDAGETQARFLGRLIGAFGSPMAERLTREPVSRNYPLSDKPEMDFVNRARGTVYGHKRVPQTRLYLFTNTDNQAKCDDIRNLVERLRFPADSVEVSVVPWISRPDFLTRSD